MSEYSGWAAGWAGFAGVMMIVVGVWHVISGLVGVFADDFFLVAQDWIFDFDPKVWGWIQLIAGVIVMLSGFGIFSGNVLGRSVGVLIAASLMILDFIWLPYYPVWSVMSIAVSGTIIWALTFHGRDLSGNY